MKKWLQAAGAAAVMAFILAWSIPIYMPGCGYVDIWLYIRYGCEAAGGGAGGAG